MNNKTVIAICYDFDKTLSPKDMQEYGVIPKLKIKPSQFWSKSNSNASTNKMDKILSYMELIISEADSRSQVTFRVDDLNKLGKDVELFPGVDTWFDRINKYAADKDIVVEHYIISAGLKEIIEGTAIARHFKEIYASCFLYDDYGKPTWPKQVVNYTQKTQYLFRISKNCLDLSDEELINNETIDGTRRIPFTNMIYLGDSDTDIPAMKVLMNYGGVPIGVYNPVSIDISKVSKLTIDKRIVFFAPADYSENSILERYIKKQIDKIVISDELTKVNYKQTKIIESMKYPLLVQNYFEDQLKKIKDVKELKKFIKNYESIIEHWKKTTADFDNDFTTKEHIEQKMEKHLSNFSNKVTQKINKSKRSKGTVKKNTNRRPK